MPNFLRNARSVKICHCESNGLASRRILVSPAYIRHSKTGLPSGFVYDDITGTGKLFLVPPELLQGFRRVMFDAITGGIAERFQQSCPGQNWNIVGFKTEKPSGFKHVGPHRESLPAQEFISFHQECFPLLTVRS